MVQAISLLKTMLIFLLFLVRYLIALAGDVMLILATSMRIIVTGVNFIMMKMNGHNRKIIQVLERYPYKVLPLYELYDADFRMPSAREIRNMGGVDKINMNMNYNNNGISSRRDLCNLTRKFL